jgi:glutamyl-tRNA reductase
MTAKMTGPEFMQRVLLLGMNHTTAPLALREKLALAPDQRDAALVRLRERFGNCEAVLLCTCNRVELYLSRETHARPRLPELTEFLAELGGIPPADLQPHIYELTDRHAVTHLFAVASSLDSMVLGETQILGQVRQAYEASCRLDFAGAMLHPLFQRALAVGKEILTQTTLAEGHMSVASVAVDCARRIFDHFGDKTILSIGAGKMAGLMLGGLAQLSPGKLLVCNRDPHRARQLAETCKSAGAKAVDFEKLADHLAGADIVVTSTGSTAPIITRAIFESVMRRRRHRPVFLIDIALPRDVAADVADLQNVYLYNLDDLQRIVAATRSQRGSAIDGAREILDQHVQQFIAWHRARQLGPVIDQLYRRSHALAQQELARTISKMAQISDAQRQHLEDLTRRIVNKLLHDPIQQLRDSENMHGPAAQYLHAMEKLFRLEEDPPEPAEAPGAPDSPNESDSSNPPQSE